MHTTTTMRIATIVGTSTCQPTAYNADRYSQVYAETPTIVIKICETHIKESSCVLP